MVAPYCYNVCCPECLSKFELSGEQRSGIAQLFGEGCTVRCASINAMIQGRLFTICVGISLDVKNWQVEIMRPEVDVSCANCKKTFRWLFPVNHPHCITCTSTLRQGTWNSIEDRTALLTFINYVVARDYAKELLQHVPKDIIVRVKNV
jgi:hypothetical protein